MHWDAFVDLNALDHTMQLLTSYYATNRQRFQTNTELANLRENASHLGPERRQFRRPRSDQYNKANRGRRDNREDLREDMRYEHDEPCSPTPRYGPRFSPQRGRLPVNYSYYTDRRGSPTPSTASTNVLAHLRLTSPEPEAERRAVPLRDNALATPPPPRNPAPPLPQGPAPEASAGPSNGTTHVAGPAGYAQPMQGDSAL